jgi:hypothetical protein
VRTTGKRRGRLADNVVQPWQFRAQHFPVEKQQSALRLVLRRGRHVSLDREMGQKRLDMRASHFARVPAPIEHDIAADPVDIRLLGAYAVVPEPDSIPHPVQQRASPRFTRIGYIHGGLGGS